MKHESSLIFVLSKPPAPSLCCRFWPRKELDIFKTWNCHMYCRLLKQKVKLAKYRVSVLAKLFALSAVFLRVACCVRYFIKAILCLVVLPLFRKQESRSRGHVRIVPQSRLLMKDVQFKYSSYFLFDHNVSVFTSLGFGLDKQTHFEG